MSRHHPWLIGLLLAPLYFGSVTAEGQVFTAVLCCTSLVLLAGRLENPSSGLSWGWIALIGTALVLPIIPLPASLVGWLSPHRLALAKEFPVDGETVPALLTLTISPAATLARLWNLLLAATVFCLARAAAREPDGARTLTLYLAFTLALLASQEIWRRATGGSMLFPDKEIPVNRGAGTFADRNHFAGWIAAASSSVWAGCFAPGCPCSPPADFVPAPIWAAGATASSCWSASPAVLPWPSIPAPAAEPSRWPSASPSGWLC